MISAFGIDHGHSIAKAEEPKPSRGRVITGTAFSPVHGLVAGKKGRKLRAAGNEWGGGIAGGLAGAALGAATRNPGVASLAALGGGIAGTGAGVHRAQRKGHYKAQVTG